MAKIIYLLIVILSSVILSTVCQRLRNRPLLANVNSRLGPPEDKSVTEAPMVDMKQNSSTTTADNPTVLVQTANSVNSDGSFEFNSHDPKIDIYIKGSLKEINGVMSIVIDGTYDNKIDNVAFHFSGNEKEGFTVEPLYLTTHILPKTVTTLLG
ncbi:unnamed protein product [Hermetia illucens]|uniref:Uncharacterized protein n=1 Tax=Hermetia illucens TaxID=343691 RepID=A0A7R8USC5_HERIL|nr:uncharacterized protein LOC119652587 [Hermetia illucens]CAD7086148.1 unnamed protein product [Hermetia illucens]